MQFAGFASSRRVVQVPVSGRGVRSLALFSVIACGLLAATVTTAGAAAPIATVHELSGSARVERGDGSRALALGDRLERGDVIETANNSTVGLVLADDTRFVIGPNASASLDDFVFEPTKGQLSVVLGTTRGAFSYLSGRVAKLNPSAVSLNTPVATAGIRGTRLAFAVRGGSDGSYPQPLWPTDATRAAAVSGGRAASATFTVLPDPDGKVGTVTVSNPAGRRVLDQRNLTTVVPSIDLPPSEPYRADEAEIAKLYGAVPAGTGGAASAAGGAGTSAAALAAGGQRFVVYFGEGAATLDPAAEGEIAKALAAAKGRRVVSIGVYGHTDRVATERANLALSERRMQAVRERLISGGVAAGTMDSTYFGEREPAVATPDETPEARNRRVEIIVR